MAKSKRKAVYVVWTSHEDVENLGCWYDDMKIKVFTNEEDAMKYFSNIPEKEGVYSDIVKKFID